MNNYNIIGFSGGTASGKTTMVSKLFNHYGKNESVIIDQDSYYKDQNVLSYEQLSKINYDHPDSIDFELLYNDLKKILNNQPIKTPVYDYKTHTRKKNEFQLIDNVNVILLEGIFALYSEKIRNLMDLKIFVDTPSDIRILRRVKRDVNKRARTIESIIKQYNDTVRPMYIKFVKPTKDYADLIIPYGGKNKTSIDTIVTNIKKNYI